MFQRTGIAGPLAVAMTFAAPVYAEDLAVDVQVMDDVDSCDRDGILDVGEVGRVVVVIRNMTDRGFSDATVRVKHGDGVQMSWNDVLVSRVQPFGTAIAEFEVQLASAVGSKQMLTAVVSVPENDGVESAHVERRFIMNVDEAVGVSNVDDVEYAYSAWVPRHNDHYGASSGWSRGKDENGNHVWFVVGSALGAHASLESPVMRPAHDVDFVVQFEQRYDFYVDGYEGTAGGVVEMTTDGGLSWQDVSRYIEVPYDGKMNEHDSALEGRSAFMGRSARLPERGAVRLNFGNQFQGESVQLRLRYAASAGERGAGWEVDNFVVEGTYNQPFNGMIPHRGKCFGATFAGGSPRVQIFLPDDVNGDAQGFFFEAEVTDATDGPEVVLPERQSPDEVETQVLVARAAQYQTTVRSSGFGRITGGQVAASGCTSFGGGASGAPLALLVGLLGFGFVSRRR